MGQLKEMLAGEDLEKNMTRLFGIIDSMTPDERRHPNKIVDQSRRRRIAAGAGVEPHEVNELVKQFDGMKSIMTSMAGKGMGDRMKMVRELQRGALTNPSGQLTKTKQGTGKRLTAEEKRKIKKQREKDLRRKNREKRS
jgi:signal recognition particle subunit SRP54